MKQNLHDTATRVFHVQVGHVRLTLNCRDEVEAVRLARRQLCDEFPRLWDVVQNFDVSRFQVRAS